MNAHNVEFRLLDSAYGLGRLNIAMTIVVVPIFAFLLTGLVPIKSLHIWGGAQMVNILVGGLAYAAWHFRKGSVQVSEFASWQKLFVVITFVGGVAWGVGPYLLISGARGAELALLIGILLTVCAVTANTMAGQPNGMFAFLLGAIAPAAWECWHVGGDAQRLLSLVLLCCLAALIITGARTAQDLRNHFKVQVMLHHSVEEAGTAREEAVATSLAKSRFLANMSHELRSPLNAVIGAAQLLKAEGGNAESQSQLVDAIQRSGKNLLGLIENILDISRIEAGELRLSLADFHLTDCVDTALATAGLAAQSKGLALACIVEPGLQPWRHGDALRLRQILLNLLGNAIKFTPTGDVTLRLSQGKGGSSHVHISVTDTGVGIGAATLPHVFEPFRQEDEGSNRRFGGSGLGLSIVRQLVLAMGGTIGVTSELGKGSCFELDMPLQAAQKIPEQPASLGIAIAYFEPHEPSALALQAQLKELGCVGKRVFDASGLRQWLMSPAAGTGQPWLLLACDHPNALSVLEGAVDLVAPDRVIGMTRGDALGNAAMANLLKLPRNIVKPVLRTELVSRLGTIRHRASAQPMTVPAEMGANAPEPVLTRVLVVEDDTLNQLIVCRLLSHGGYETMVASDGAQALALMASETFHLVLMDWQMPDMDGLEVTRRLRAGQSGSAGMVIPIVALTANAFAEDRAACLAAGMNDFLTKPVQSELLLATVKQWTSSVPREPETPVHHHPEAIKTDTRPPAFDPAVMAALPMVADGSEPHYAQELMAMFLESLGQTQREIDQALAAQDLVKLRRVVHSLKSSSATVGAMELASLAETHENSLRQGKAPVPELPRIMALAMDRLRVAVSQPAS